MPANIVFTFKANKVNFLTFALVGGLLLAAFLLYRERSSQDDWAYVWPHILQVTALISFFAGIFNYWRYLKISEAPISTIAAAAQGYIEVTGKANCDTPLKTPYQNISCVWYRAWVYANRADRQRGNHIANTRLLDYSESALPFKLADATGVCTVNPKGAEVIHLEKRTFYKNDHRYVEEFLPSNQALYVLGYLDSRRELNDAAAIHRDTGVLLSAWKADRKTLLNRFDINHDGTIDIDEWEQARAEARQEVALNHARLHSDGFTLQKTSARHLFIISALSPQLLRSQYLSFSLLHLAVLLSLLGVYFLR